MTQQHPWQRYVAVGDSFTEGVGDSEPRAIGGLRGWADRVAEVLNDQTEDFAYANLAIRGRLIQQILDEQVEPALEMRPDLISLCAGGNDLLRPGGDPDEVAQRLEQGVAELSRDNATLLIFTGVDVKFSPVFRMIRGKVAIYNENIHAIADKYDAIVADQWKLRELHDPRMWDSDRLHLSPLGHHTVALMVLEALNIRHSLEPETPETLPSKPRRVARAEDLEWAREYLVPWVVRRIRHQSSGDGRSPKRPIPEYFD